MPYITKIDFGDGNEVTCSYGTSSLTSEDCDTFVSKDGRTQYCYHTYQRSGWFTVMVAGYPGYYGPLTAGAVQVKIGDPTASPEPTPVFPTPSEQPYRRSC